MDCATYLLENGADMFAIDKHLRRSAIHYAAASNKAAVLKRLLDENTKVHTDEGLQPLRDVRVHDMSGQCRYIDSRAENGMTALHLAAAFSELETLQVTAWPWHDQAMLDQSLPEPLCPKLPQLGGLLGSVFASLLVPHVQLARKLNAAGRVLVVSTSQIGGSAKV